MVDDKGCHDDDRVTRSKEKDIVLNRIGIGGGTPPDRISI